MSPLHDQTPVGSIPTRRLKAVNASLSSIAAGIQPVIQDAGGNYFRFANGQIRRQIGSGHSRFERRQRRLRRAWKAVIKTAARENPVGFEILGDAGKLAVLERQMRDNVAHYLPRPGTPGTHYPTL